jgi:hypothetical protein
MPALPAATCSVPRRAVLSLAAAVLLPLLAACATQVSAQSAVDMSIVDRDSGQTLTVYRKAGRSYVAGRPASRYAIRLSNRSAGRVMVVLSVDGVNVVSGQTASWNQGGYVLEPWGSYDITGWRKSDTAIAAFEFAALRDSYAARTGRPANVGVIGMAVFLERPASPPVGQLSMAPQAATADAAAAAKSQADGGADAVARNAARESVQSMTAAPDRLGTAHGQREWSVSTRTSFERLDATPQAVVEIAYDSYQNLVAAGIIRAGAAHANARAFPLNQDADGYVADPPAR